MVVIEAPDEETADELAIEAFDSSKPDEMDTECKSEIITPGQKLSQQGSEKHLFWHTHFDCWNDTEDCDMPTWEWDDDRAVTLCGKLMGDAARKTDCDDFRELYSPDEMYRGQVKLFEKVEELFISLGYDVYNSDTMLEVYSLPTPYETPT